MLDISKIKFLIEKTGMNIIDFATTIDMTDQGLYKIFQRKATTNKTLQKLADALGVNPYELFEKPEPTFTSENNIVQEAPAIYQTANIADNLNERIKILVEKLCEGNQARFAGRCGMSEHNISSYVLGKAEPNVKSLQKISDCFPELNLRWLLMGKGEMFQPEVDLKLCEKEREMLRRILKDKEEIIQLLKNSK